MFSWRGKEEKKNLGKNRRRQGKDGFLDSKKPRGKGRNQKGRNQKEAENETREKK